jgi:hypothetical protein
MPYIPIVMPESSKIDRFGTETDPRTPFFTGLRYGFEDALQNTFTGTLGFEAEKWYVTHHDPGEWLGAEEAQEKYPNVSYPKGGYDNVIRLNSNRKARQQLTAEVLDNMDKTAFSYLGRGAVFLAANFLDPIQMAMGEGIGALYSKPASMLLSKIPEMATTMRSLATAGLGALEGTVQVAPYIGLQAYEGKEIQQPMTALGAFLNLSIGAGIGGLARTVLGFKKMVSQETGEAIVHTAKQQVMSGKEVTIDPIFQQGLHEGYKQGWKDILSEVEGREDTTGNSFVAEEKPLSEQPQIETKPGETRPGFDEVNKVFEDGKKRYQTILDDVDGKIEEENVKVEEEIAKSSDPEMVKKARDFGSFEDFKKAVPEAVEKVFNEAKKITSKLERLEKAKEDVEDILRDTEAYQDFLNKGAEPLTPQQLKTYSNYLNSWQGEKTTYMHDYNMMEDYRTTEQPTLDEELKDWEDSFQSKEDEGLVDQVHKDAIETLERDTKKMPTVKEGLVKAIQCILGRPE